jgi:hypothetical protein
MIPKRRTQIKKLSSGIKLMASANGLWSTERIVREKYNAWLIRRGFKEEAP